MHILLFGSNGQLGWELQRTLPSLGKITAFDIDRLDITNSDELVKTIRIVRPDIIINASAYTAVDRAETEKDTAMMVNGVVPGILAEEAKKISASLIHFSTDYVFDGKKVIPYLETDDCSPINYYGISKLAGEKAIHSVENPFIILRTSWVYRLKSNNFITKVIEWAKKNNTIRIVTDQIGNPTWSRMLAEVTAQMLSMSGNRIYDWTDQHKGIYHLAGSGSASRFEVANAALEFYRIRHTILCQNVLPASTSDFPAPAERPLCTALNCERFSNTFCLKMPDWKESLRLAFEDL